MSSMVTRIVLREEPHRDRMRLEVCVTGRIGTAEWHGMEVVHGEPGRTLANDLRALADKIDPGSAAPAKPVWRD